MPEQEPHADKTDMSQEGVPSRVPIWHLVRYYLRLGALGFGGPVALCGQMEKELVGERKWLTPEEMREAIAVCQSMPVPLAIQVGIFISYLRGGGGPWPDRLSAPTPDMGFCEVVMQEVSRCVRPPAPLPLPFPRC